MRIAEGGREALDVREEVMHLPGGEFENVWRDGSIHHANGHDPTENIWLF